MEPVFNVVLPVFAIILTGYVAGRLGLLGESATDALNSFVYWVALPVLFFHAMATVPSDQLFDVDYVGAYMLSILIVYVLGYFVSKLLFRNDAGQSSLFAMSTMFANTGYMGIPLAIVAYGEAGALPAIIATVFQTVIFMAVPVCIIEISNNKGGLGVALKGTAVALLKNPMIVSPILGIAYSFTGLGVPAPVETYATVLGAAAGPCALFALGLFLVGKPISQGKLEVSAMVALKMIAHPLIAWWLAIHVFDVRADWLPILILMAALPTGATVFVLAQRYQLYVQRASTATLASTVVAVITVSILFGLDF